jgi:hypothetical protein
MKGNLTADEVRIAGRTLKFLCEHGWKRPNKMYGTLWIEFAEKLVKCGEISERERRQYLTTALRYVENQ